MNNAVVIENEMKSDREKKTYARCYNTTTQKHIFLTSGYWAYVYNTSILALIGGGGDGGGSVGCYLLLFSLWIFWTQ